MRNKGMALILLIMIVAVLGIFVFGISAYITEGLFFNILSANSEKALYMAQAGIMKGLQAYINTGSFTTERDINVVGEFYYNLGNGSSFLSVDATTPKINSKQLRGIPLKNLDSVNSITITSLIVEWTFGGNITDVKLGNTFVWNGSSVSPATLTLSSSLTLAPGQAFTSQNDQIWRFSLPITGDVVCTFVFSDGSSRQCYLLKNGGGANNEFPLTATGKITGGAAGISRRTLTATYDIGTNKITSWQETQNHILP